MNTESIQSSFQFMGSKVLSCTLKNDFVSVGSDIAPRCTAEYSLGQIEEHDGAIFGTVILTVSASLKEKESGGKFNCKVEIEGCFGEIAAYGEEKFLSMLSVNGCALLYSLARAYISTISALSINSGKITLPMINTFKLSEKGEKKQAK